MEIIADVGGTKGRWVLINKTTINNLIIFYSFLKKRENSREYKETFNSSRFIITPLFTTHISCYYSYQTSKCHFH